MNADPQSILIFRNGSLGNTIVSIPAIRAIRQRWPRAQMHIVVDSVGGELFAKCPWFDSVIVYEKRRADRGFLAHVRLIRRLRGLRLTHAVLFKRFFRNGLLAYLSGAKIRIGFSTAGSAPFLNLTADYAEGTSIIELNMRLASLMDAKSDNFMPVLFLDESDRRHATEFLRQQDLHEREYLVAHYGGLTTAPDFVSPVRFRELLALVSRGIPVVLVGSGERERVWLSTVSDARSGWHLACDLPLRTLGAILESARMFVGFNSGPAHLASAAGCPTVVLFRSDGGVRAEIKKWRPAGESSVALIPPRSVQDGDWAQFIADAAIATSQLERSHSASGAQ